MPQKQTEINKTIRKIDNPKTYTHAQQQQSKETKQGMLTKQEREQNITEHEQSNQTETITLGEAEHNRNRNCNWK